MKPRMVAGGIVVLTLVIAVGAFWWFRTPEWRRSYAQVRGGITITQVREIIGREEDKQDDRETTTGEVERSWTFSDGIRITVVFDANGLSSYKEIAPDHCGVTPLMGKYVEK